MLWTLRRCGKWRSIDWHFSADVSEHPVAFFFKVLKNDGGSSSMPMCQSIRRHIAQDCCHNLRSRNPRLLSASRTRGRLLSSISCSYEVHFNISHDKGTSRQNPWQPATRPRVTLVFTESTECSKASPPRIPGGTSTQNFL